MKILLRRESPEIVSVQRFLYDLSNETITMASLTFNDTTFSVSFGGYSHISYLATYSDKAELI
jgi:hypothetical protein